MPPPFPVELVPYDPKWVDAARERAAQLHSALGPLLVEVHHVGPTSIPGILAKPIIDLIPEVASIRQLDAQREVVGARGYEWWGEFGLAGRRYCTLIDATSGKRLVQLHCYETGSLEITRHIAFRDYLRRRPELAAEYEAVKRRCREQHPENSHDYTDCKSDWIRRVQAEAMAAAGAG